MTGYEQFPRWERGERSRSVEVMFESVDVGLAEKDKKGEDRSLVRTKDGLLGVFDGAGGEPNGDLAAGTAQRVLGETDLTADTDAAEAKASLIGTMEQLDRSVRDEAEGGVTTAVVARLVAGTKQDGLGLALVWASVGDSRIYLLRGSQLSQLSEDEGSGSTLYRALGGKQALETYQSGVEHLEKGDRLLLVSDGITGDFDSDILSDEEITEACTRATSATQAAQNLVRVSRKHDDKTALVVDV